MAQKFTPAFKPGDVVQMKSGGSKMTVVGYGFEPGPMTSFTDSLLDSTSVRCKWLRGAKLESGMFEEVALLLVKDK
jgi:uncharacterized protein YodC (DUF2158 family)